MKKYMLNLKENEEMMIDVDDQMESIMDTFTESVKDINENDLNAFSNWVKVYKMLNYDIIPDLEIEKVYRINNVVAAVILKFRGVREFDLLSFNHKEMTVTCLNTKDGKARDYAVRRLIIPTTTEEALMYAKRDLDEEGKKVLVKAFDQIKEHGKEIDVTVAILNNNGLIKLEENNKGENKMKETNNNNNMETTNKETKTTKSYMDYYNEMINNKPVENNNSNNNEGENKMKETKTTKSYMDYYNEMINNKPVETKTTKSYMDYYNELRNSNEPVEPETKKIKSMKEILKEMDTNGGRFSLAEVKAAMAAGLY